MSGSGGTGPWAARAGSLAAALLCVGTVACSAALADDPGTADRAALVDVDRLPVAFHDPAPRYAAMPTAGGWRFAGGGLDVALDARAGAPVVLRAGELSIAVGVVAVERGGHRLALGAPRLEVEGARARITRGDDVEELFVHGAPGVEHAIGVRRAPAGDEPLAVVVSLAGAAHVEVAAEEARAVDARGRTVATYAGLRAWDARGVALPAHMEADARGVRLLIDDRGALPPILIDPLIAAPRAVLTASDRVVDDVLGSAVAVEGDLAIVGAPDRAGGGAAYVFERTAGTWAEHATLVPPMASSGDYAGRAVAISGDTVVVGSPGDNHPIYSSAGAVDVFRRVAAGWAHEARITNPGPLTSLERFGGAVAIAGDVMVVGADGARTGGMIGSGAAYVYRRTGTTWAPDGGALVWSRLSSNDDFGWTVATDGTRVAVGAPYENGMILDGSGFVMYEDVGAVFVFVRGTGGAWTEEARLAAATERSYEYLGTSLAIDGTRVIAGADGADATEGLIERRGAAYVFARSGSTWSEEARLLPAPASDWVSFASFGSSVAIDGTLATVGAPGARSNGVGYVFERGAGGWALADSVTGGLATRDLGEAMGLDGTTWVVGAPGEDGDRGAAHVFEIAETGAIGQPCGGPTDCTSGFCADGVCCDLACAGGPTDCLACSVAAGAAADGACGPIVAGTVCRAAVGACDAAEACDGTATECPADARASAGTVCRAAAGPCDREETCSGTAITCPFDAAQGDGTACDDGLACNGADACAAGLCAPSATPLDCDDGDACTADSCDDAGGCTHTAIEECCAGDADCDDGDACTTDTCAASSCAHDAVAGCGEDAGPGAADAGAEADASAAMPDAGTGPGTDAGTDPPVAGGCGCGVAARPSATSIGALLGLGAVVLARRRRRRRCRS